MVVAEQEAEARLRGTSRSEVRARLLEAVPSGRLCTTEDVAAMVIWLTGEGAGYVTGQALCTNGGSILH
jgi:NAD(P)-dependent dehydrogenase (short-subunit alcohol dehydrogenase family)